MLTADFTTFAPTMGQAFEYVSINTGRTEWDYSNSYENTLQKMIAEKISEVNEVERIYCQRETEFYFIWIIINTLDPKVRREIYKKQLAIIDLFRGETFDFYVIAREGKSPDSVINQGSELIYQRMT